MDGGNIPESVEDIMKEEEKVESNNDIISSAKLDPPRLLPSENCNVLLEEDIIS